MWGLSLNLSKGCFAVLETSQFHEMFVCFCWNAAVDIWEICCCFLSHCFCPLWFCVWFMTELVLKWEKTVQNDEREYEKVKNEENRHMNVSEPSFFRLPNLHVLGSKSVYGFRLKFVFLVCKLHHYYVSRCMCVVFTEWQTIPEAKHSWPIPF